MSTLNSQNRLCIVYIFRMLVQTGSFVQQVPDVCFYYIFNLTLPLSVVVNENVSLVISRQLLSDFCVHLTTLPDSTSKAVCHFTLEKIQPRVISFEEQVSGCGDGSFMQMLLPTGADRNT